MTAGEAVQRVQRKRGGEKASSRAASRPKCGDVPPVTGAVAKACHIVHVTSISTNGARGRRGRGEYKWTDQARMSRMEKTKRLLRALMSSSSRPRDLAEGRVGPGRSRQAGRSRRVEHRTRRVAVAGPAAPARVAATPISNEWRRCGGTHLCGLREGASSALLAWTLMLSLLAALLLRPEPDDGAGDCASTAASTFSSGVTTAAASTEPVEWNESPSSAVSGRAGSTGLRTRSRSNSLSAPVDSYSIELRDRRRWSRSGVVADSCRGRC